jgi:lipoprotein-anchoring transpeptidase ErfK/SrfK
MNLDPESAQQAVLNAQEAIQQGDRRTARHWAETAAALSPDLEEPWLILAALANPQASIKYLQRALKINPSSGRAREGMLWAVARLRKMESRTPFEPASLADTQPGRALRREGTQKGVQNVSPTQPTPARKHPRKVSKDAAQPNSRTSKSLAKYRWSFLILILLVVCATASWVFLPGNTVPALAMLHIVLPTQQILGAPAQLDKPSYTPSSTPTSTPTDTLTPTPTFTLTPTPTNTDTPTETPVPTDTPIPTAIPTPTEPPIPADLPYVYPDNGGVRWIDVNLSTQRLYAYEGDTVVASFLVSTGVPAFPTVTGQYHIYIKLLSALMTGSGYYLPDVPYTMYFYKGYGIHGTYWHHNFGHPMSHGCVNMYTPDAEWMFYWAHVGTLVNIHY